MNYWFSSDWHLGHRNILEYDKRPFKTIEGHDVTLLYNYQKCVKEGDNFYFIGDFALSNFRYAELYLSQMQGNKFFIRGNHDNKDIIKLYKKYGTYLGELAEIKIKGQRISLCHYSMRVWNKSHHGAWHLYGHSHGSLEHSPHGKSFDVAVNLWNYKPISFEQVATKMTERDISVLDHHVMSK